MTCKRSDVRKAALGVLRRAVLLIVIGIATQGGDLPEPGNPTWSGWNLETLRPCGILQRVAVVSAVTAWMELAWGGCNSEAPAHAELRQAEAGLSPLAPSEQTEPLLWTGGTDAAPRDDAPLRAAALAATRALRQRWRQWAVTLAMLGAYSICIFALSVPSWRADGDSPEQACPGRATLGPACNAARRIDHAWLGYARMYGTPAVWNLDECQGDDPPAFCAAPFEPEGSLSTLPCLLSAQLGAHFGALYVPGKGPPVAAWATQAVLLALAGLSVAAAGWPLNKQLWSPSYALLTAGIIGAFMALSAHVLDGSNAFGADRPRHAPPRTRVSQLLDPLMRPLVWVGANALLVYLGAAAGVLDAGLALLYYGSPENNIVDLAQRTLFGGSDVLLVLVRIVAWIAIAGWLKRKNWLWAL